MHERILFLLTGGQRLLPETISTPPLAPPELKDRINTDQIYPAQACLFFKNLGLYALSGLTGIEEGDLLKLNPHVIVAGQNFGCGSAREHAPLSLLEAGIKLIIAESLDPTFRENCRNLGLICSSNLDLVEKFINGEAISQQILLAEYTEEEKAILELGGLFAYTRERQKGRIKPPEISTGPRPMTITEKIIAKHLTTDQGKPVWVKPNDQCFLPLDARMSYEVFTPLMAELLGNNLPEFPVADPQSVNFFSDHFVANLSQPNHPIHSLTQKQRRFAQEHNIRVWDNNGQCDQGIGHNLMIEGVLYPGQIGAGTDSHTSMWGVLGALGIPVGATTMANALVTKDILFSVPESVKVNFEGGLSSNVSARDVMFYLLKTLPLDIISGKVMEFAIDNLDLPVDELAVLTCLAKELGALTAIMAPNDQVIKYLVARGLPKKQVKDMIVASDPDACYSAEFNVDLSIVKPMVLPPPIPNIQPPLEINQLPDIPIQRVYIGGCVGGKWHDLKQTAATLKGKKIPLQVELLIQPATLGVYQRMLAEGMLKIFQQAGAKVLTPNCGACIGQGEGKVTSGETAVFTTTRNYGGRMKAALVWLASPKIACESALLGKIWQGE